MSVDFTIITSVARPNCRGTPRRRIAPPCSSAKRASLAKASQPAPHQLTSNGPFRLQPQPFTPTRCDRPALFPLVDAVPKCPHTRDRSGNEFSGPTGCKQPSSHGIKPVAFRLAHARQLTSLLGRTADQPTAERRRVFRHRVKRLVRVACGPVPSGNLPPRPVSPSKLPCRRPTRKCRPAGWRAHNCLESK